MLRFALLASMLCVGLVAAQETKAPRKSADGQAKDADKKSHPMASLRLRGIGPALLSGRISGVAVHPEDRSKYFVAVASGGVWKTDNAGVTWRPVFDNEGSYSIGCVVLDPKNPNAV